eukprot:63910_1
MGENVLPRLIHPKHRKAAQLWSKLCHKIDISYPPKDQLTSIDIKGESNSKLMSEIRYSMRHSFCVYQSVLVGMKSEEISLSFKTQSSLLKTCFNICDEDVIMDNCTLKLHNFMSKTHEPTFYLIVDHKENKIVLSIRGTSSIGDLLTDLNAVTKNFEFSGINGFVHEGMVQAAYFIRRNVSLQLVNLCEIYPDYGVIICGHSLGAGIAALLGLMYKDHPIIHKQNQLKVYAFASPCIVSKEFTDCALGNEYITSIALSTDLVTRLSVESVRKCHLRQDFIMKQSKNLIHRCMTHDTIDGEIENESACAEFLRVLRSLSSFAPSQELYPLGRILWFVPHIVMHDDIAFRRSRLMDLKEDDLDMEEEDGNRVKSTLDDVCVSTWNSMSKSVTDFKASMMDLNTFEVRCNDYNWAKHSFREFCHDVSKGVKDIQTDIEWTLDKAKRNRKYNGENYVLCDASSCRYIFQELVFDLPESIRAHEPQRYLWACDATLRDYSL